MSDRLHAPATSDWLSGRLFFLVLHVLNLHVVKFVGVEDFAAVQALDKLHIVFARHYADLRVLTDRVHGVFGGCDSRYGADCTRPEASVNSHLRPSLTYRV